MRLKAAKAAALCCVSFMALVRAAPSPQNSGVSKDSPLKTTTPDNDASRNHYPSKDAPFPVQVIQSNEEATSSTERERKTDKFNSDYLDTQERMAKAGEEQVWAATWLTFIAFLEILISAAALIFLIRTFRETKRTADAAKESADASKVAADASKRSADTADISYKASNTANTETLKRMETQLQLAHAEFIASHRPRIRVRKVIVIKPSTNPYGKIVGKESMFPFVDGYPIECEVHIKNVGETQAQITGIGCWVEYVPSPHLPLPMRHPHEWDNPNISLKVVLQAGTGTNFRVDRREVLPEGNASALFNGQMSCCVMGWIEYTDTGKATRYFRTDFCRQFDAQQMRFVPVANPDYEYEE